MTLLDVMITSNRFLKINLLKFSGPKIGKFIFIIRINSVENSFSIYTIIHVIKQFYEEDGYVFSITSSKSNISIKNNLQILYSHLM